jgi:hypothetical protein
MQPADETAFGMAAPPSAALYKRAVFANSQSRKS